MRQRITEQKLKDKRFRETEKAILIAFFSVQGKIGTKQLIKKANISRSTFNRHHKNVYEIIPDYEVYIMRKYMVSMGRLAGKRRVEARSIYRKMLLFMFQNRVILKMLIENEEKEIIEKMVEIIEPKVIKIEENYEPEILKVHMKEVVGLIELWGLRGFEREEIEKMFEKIMFLTENLKVRLAPIGK